MNSSLSIIPSFDHFASTDTTHPPKDYTYADEYPIFISQEKLSKLIGISPKSSKLSYLSPTLPKPPQTFPSIPKQPPQSLDFHYSKFPSSSLNVELKKQCLLSELYQNLDKIKFKEKTFPPIKVDWQKSRIVKNTVKAAKVNMKAVIHGESLNLSCEECGNLRCVCRVTDSFCDEMLQSAEHRFGGRKEMYSGVVRSRLYGRTRRLPEVRNKTNCYVERIEQKRTRRRMPGRKNFESLNDEVLVVSPKNIYMKVLADEDNDEN